MCRPRHRRSKVSIRSAIRSQTRARAPTRPSYLELGSYRGAADLCGVDHKTVKRAVQRWRAGTVAQPRATPPGGHNADCVEDLIFDKVRKTRCRITAKRLLPQTRAAGYTGSPDDANASSTETFNLFLRR